MDNTYGLSLISCSSGSCLCGRVGNRGGVSSGSGLLDAHIETALD